MGLFSKKKELPLASDPFRGGQPPFDLNDIPSPPSSLQEPIGIPPPPQSSQMPPMFPSGFGSQPELPAFDSPQSYSSQIPSPPPSASQQSFIPPAPSAPGPTTLKQQPEPGFELPDFDDEEIKKLEQANWAEEKPVEEPAPKKEPEKEEPASPFTEYEKIRAPIGKIPYPEEEKHALPKGEKFLDLKTLFSVKDEIESLKLVFRSFDESIENHVSKTKLEMYHSLGNTLNNIQDKIMTIDSKLFEP